MESVELLVRMDCSGCERKVRKQLSKMKGVESVEIDVKMNKVTVIGYADRRKVLKAVRKTGKRAEFWQEIFAYYNQDNNVNDHNYVQPSMASHSNSSNLYTNSIYGHGYHSSSSFTRPTIFGSSLFEGQQQPFKRTYNYEKHGYNHYHGLHEDEGSFYGPADHVQASTMFSDENPNACSIM